jgi:hypothetical protein
LGSSQGRKEVQNFELELIFAVQIFIVSGFENSSKLKKENSHHAINNIKGTFFRLVYVTLTLRTFQEKMSHEVDVVSYFFHLKNVR